MNINDQLAQPRREGHIEFFIEERGRDCVKSRMPVTKGILNPFGIVQAGALLWLADVTASILSIENFGIEGNGKGFPLAIDLHSSFLGNQRDGEIQAEAKFVRKGRRVTVIRTRVTGTENRLLAEVTTTHVPVV